MSFVCTFWIETSQLTGSTEVVWYSLSLTGLLAYPQKPLQLLESPENLGSGAEVPT